jgi:hypothetical protein
MKSMQMSDIAAIQFFTLAGDATFTLVSEASGARFTYRVREPEQLRGNITHFVSVLTGSDNENAFSYLGQVRSLDCWQQGVKSKIGPGAPSARAFAYFWHQVMARGVMPSKLQFWHEGRCCACGRKLTVPDSLARGLGPDCAAKRGITINPPTKAGSPRPVFAQEVQDWINAA